MKLVYLSMDELNQSLVRGWAGRLGIRVDCRVAIDRSKPDPHDAFLLDTDHLPSGWLQAFIERLGGAGEDCPVAAHGYGAPGNDLRDRGVRVHRRLRAGVVRDLIHAAMSSESARVSDASEPLTWVNLA